MVHSAQGKGRILSAIAKWSLFYIRTATTGVLAVGSDVTQQFFHLLLAVFLKEKKEENERQADKLPGNCILGTRHEW